MALPLPEKLPKETHAENRRFLKVEGVKKDWGKSVKKAMADTTRCKAPSELLSAERVSLVEDVDPTVLKEFIRILY